MEQQIEEGRRKNRKVKLEWSRYRKQESERVEAERRK
jgi:hypothetical protein